MGSSKIGGGEPGRALAAVIKEGGGARDEVSRAGRSVCRMG